MPPPPSIMLNPAANNEAEWTLIKDVRNHVQNINVEFIVLEIERETKTKDGATVRCFKVADETGCMAISLWDEMGAPIRPGDIMRLLRGYAGPYRGCLTLYTGRNGELQKVGEFCKEFSEEPNFSELNPELLVQESQQQQHKHLNKNSENQQHQNKQQSAAGKQDRNQRGGGGGGGGNHYTPHQNHPGGNTKNKNNNAQPGTLQSFASKHLVGAPRGDWAFGGAAGRPGGRNAASQVNATGVVASSATINASRDPRRAKR